jgi:hypothetical protein
MINFLVETKNEYTTHLVNVLAPLIFEGLQSIYKESLTLAGTNDILKCFQTCLKRIPKWNQAMIETETNRILTSTHSHVWLNDLIKATLKAHLIVLTHNPTSKIQPKIDKAYYQDIKTTDFIHKVYIECARDVWNNPFLLYHNYPPIEIKRNQRDCMIMIKDCIKEAIRKMLPVQHILQLYLGADMEIENNNDEFDKVLSDVEKNNLNKLVKKDLNDEMQMQMQGQGQMQSKEPILIGGQDNLLIAPKLIEKKTTEEQTINTRILNIIKDKSEENSESLTAMINKSSTSSSTSSTSDSNVVYMNSNKNKHNIIGGNALNNVNNNALNNVNNNALNNINNDNQSVTIDDKIKNILKKDLASDSDFETSLNYSQDNKYQEIFSNSNLKSDNNNKDKNNTSQDKKKFFNNYLQF